MAKKEVTLDYFVAKQLEENNIVFDAQGSTVKEINEALKTASKRGTGRVGFPEFVAVVGDFVVVIEDKANLERHILLTDEQILDTSVKAISDYAVNGAFFYAKHIAQHTNFKKVFALGISGDEKHHRITPLWVDDRETYKQLPDVESLVWFDPKNIDEYYTRYVLESATDVEKTTEQILKDAAELHEYLRTYGTLKDQDKPLVVAGILLALDEIEYKGFSLESLTGDQIPGSRDGDKITTAIRNRLTRSNVGPDAKKDRLMAEFSIFETSFRLNEHSQALGKTPLKFFTEFLYEHVFKNIKYQKTAEDFIGRFYGEFMSYSGGDGQTLGIILTPSHITDLMCDLVGVGPEDVVLDPCCGTAGFLIAAMHKMVGQAKDEHQIASIKKRQLHGIEMQSNMFAVAATNMILRRDGNSNLECADFLAKNPAQLQLKGATVGLMNPPYSQGNASDPSQYELSFTEHLLDSLTVGARAAVIVPQPSMTGKYQAEKAFKASIMAKHTLEGVITCNTDTFYRVGTNPAIAVFTAGQPHPSDHQCKFIDFRDDGFKVRAHIGLVATGEAKDRKQHLLDAWEGKLEAPTKFCVTANVTPEDEWLHSFFYFNDEIPTDGDFEKSIGDYLTFELSMIMQNRGYLFGSTRDFGTPFANLPKLLSRSWRDFLITDVFPLIQRGKRLKRDDHKPGDVPYVSSTARNNGVDAFISKEPGVRVFNDCISLANSGSVGTAFYEPFEYIASDHVTSLKRTGASKYVYLFLTSAIEKQSSNFNFNREINDSRIRKLRIMLPANPEGQPDYAYMEQYAKNMMYKKYRQYLTFLDSRQPN